ncbi:hypothetical protein [uncultured Friedmanniella sp.]|uniref:hypothetical protein n=1 Tax=uncultured Friedmanniella sp. TaxID=335381 RepID=UPI0035CC66F6
MPETPQEQLEQAGGITKALLDTLDQLVDRILGQQTVDKSGKPLRQVAYMHMPNGLPVDPRQYANPWTPAGGATLAKLNNDGTLPKVDPVPPPVPQPAAPAGTPPVTPVPVKPTQDQALMASMQAALNTAWLFDEMPMVTGDGTYRPYPSTRKLSSAYEGLVHSVQAVPPPPQPADVAQALADAEKVLYNHDADGNITGPSIKFQNWIKFSQSYADAKATFATQQAQAMADPILGSVWPATGASLQQKVDTAYQIWRSSGADDVEKALDLMNSEGGSAAAHFVSQARELLDKWDLSLAGAVAVRTPYTQVTPASWYDHTNNDIGFAGISASSDRYHSSGGAQSSSFANSWYKGTSSSTQASAGASFFGISIGGSGGGSSSESDSAGHQGGQSSSQHADSSTTASISCEFGVIKIERPWLLTELFHIGGWYVPGEKAGCVSDGTIAGQDGDDKKLLPMITTQALVIRNVTITATGWGAAGQALSEYQANQAAHSDSSSWNAGGSVGFMGFGGSVSHTESDWAGSQSSDASSSWGFSYDSFTDTGTLTINGSQIAGYIGEIVGSNPRLDDPNVDKPADTTTDPAPADSTPTTDGTPTSDGSGTPVAPILTPAGANV